MAQGDSSTPCINFLRIKSQNFIIRKTYDGKRLLSTLNRLWEGGTSLISNLAISLTSRPARFKAMGIAKLGAIVKSIGCVAASPQDRILAIGFAEVVLDLARVVNTSAEAPSLIAEAFAAVTVPSFLSLSEDKEEDT
jgi:hypothetical protein